MAYLGMLALGVFVGTLLGTAVRKTTDWSNSVQVIVGILGAALSGVVFTFIDALGKTPLGSALFMYPLGLTWSLLWLYAGHSIENVRSSNGEQRIIGWLHVTGMVVGTGLVLLLLLSQRFRDLLPKGP